jgi:hypothetical protein
VVAKELIGQGSAAAGIHVPLWRGPRILAIEIECGNHGDDGVLVNNAMSK